MAGWGADVGRMWAAACWAGSGVHTAASGVVRTAAVVGGRRRGRWATKSWELGDGRWFETTMDHAVVSSGREEMEI